MQALHHFPVHALPQSDHVFANNLKVLFGCHNSVLIQILKHKPSAASLTRDNRTAGPSVPCTLSIYLHITDINGNFEERVTPVLKDARGAVGVGGIASLCDGTRAVLQGHFTPFYWPEGQFHVLEGAHNCL